MLDLPHKGIAPDMLGEVRRSSASSASTRRATSSTRRSFPRRSAGTWSRSPARAVIFRASSSAWLARGDPPRERVRANARLAGRDEVTIDDVQEMAPYVLRTA